MTKIVSVMFALILGTLLYVGIQLSSCSYADIPAPNGGGGSSWRPPITPPPRPYNRPEPALPWSAYQPRSRTSYAPQGQNFMGINNSPWAYFQTLFQSFWGSMWQR